MTPFQAALKEHPEFRSIKELLKLAKRLGNREEKQTVEKLYEKYADRHAKGSELVFPAA